MDWTPLYDTIFTRSIRAMGLSIREGKVAVSVNVSHLIDAIMFERNSDEKGFKG